MCEAVISVIPGGGRDFNGRAGTADSRQRTGRRAGQSQGGGRAERIATGENMLPLWVLWMCIVLSSGLLSHVERYEVVRPQRLRERQKRSLEENQLYPDTVQYELTIEGKNHTIHLEKNNDLIGRDYTETHYSEDGRRVTTSPSEDLCYYHGRVQGVDDSSVSVGICSGIRGFVRARQQVYLIEPLGQSDDGDHAIYRHEDLKVKGRPGCGATSDTTTTMLQDREQEPRPAGLLRSRSLKSKSDPSEQMFVELYVVYKRYGSETKSRILGVINHVDKLYRPLNIRVLLVGLEIWTYKDFIDVDINSETTLDHFLMWRQADLLKRIKHDNAQFVTGIDFDSDTVGLANKFAMCTENSGGVNQDHHNNAIGLASTIAHEMGHNFGLSHDRDGCVCGPSLTSDCVMAEKLRTGNQAFPELFSSCSLDQLSDFLERAQPSCLSKPTPLRTVAVGPRCGNALLDPGEECDCGTVEECRNPCCDAATCRLTAGSQCAHGQCCENCQVGQPLSSPVTHPSSSLQLRLEQFRGAWLCRKLASDCDLPEFCTGMSGDCPEDAFEMNGKPCVGHGAGYCYNGQCPTHEQHCQRLFGPGTFVGPDLCFDLNRRGEEGANCGRSRFGFMPCTPQNFKCGTIFCGGGGESITGKRAAYTVYEQIDQCNSRLTSLHLQVCNHKNECHCDPGWAPPYCNIQFADLPQGQTGIIAGVCSALAILLVVTVAIAVLKCCKRDNMDNYSSKRKVHSAPGKLNPMFQEAGVKDRPQISNPTFMASTATQARAPLIVTAVPSRPAPQPPNKASTSSTSSSSSVSTSQPEPLKGLTEVKQLHMTFSSLLVLIRLQFDSEAADKTSTSSQTFTTSDYTTAQSSQTLSSSCASGQTQSSSCSPSEAQSSSSSSSLSEASLPQTQVKLKFRVSPEQGRRPVVAPHDPRR
ncbi:hypothetical protein INR49_008950, partial [Caranx melampygus]